MITNFKLFENIVPINNNEHDNILVVVDVQKEFSEYIPQGYIEKLDNYCKNFKSVYQIWDSNLAIKPSYKFKNQKNIFSKRFGYKWFSGDIKKFSDTYTLKNKKIGDKFEINNTDTYIVYTHNDHKWFHVNEKLSKLFKKLSGKKIILVGGADFECLTDVKISMESFGVDVIINHEYVYSSLTNSNQKVNQNV